MLALEILIPNDEREYSNHDHTMVSKFTNLNDIFKKIGGNGGFYKIAAGNDTLVMTSEGSESVHVFKFCGLYKYLAPTTNGYVCKAFENYELLNIGFVKTNLGKPDPEANDEKENALNGKIDLVELTSGETITHCNYHIMKDKGRNPI